MKSLLLIAAVLTLGTVIALTTASAEPESAHAASTHRSAPTAEHGILQGDAASSSMAECLFDTMIVWRRVPDCARDDCTSWEAAHHEPVAAARIRYAEIAGDIARHASAPLSLLAIAFMESGFERLVDDGTCNSPALVASMDLPYHCDQGFAHSIFQIHDARLTPDDRPRAVVAAQTIFDVSPMAWTTWPRARALAVRRAFDAPDCF
jgi:hypothetical protein